MGTQHAPAAPSVDRLVSSGEAAERLGVSAKTVRRYVEAGVLPAVRLTPTSQLKFRLRDIDAVIERGLTKEEA